MPRGALPGFPVAETYEARVSRSAPALLGEEPIRAHGVVAFRFPFVGSRCRRITVFCGDRAKERA